MPFLDEVGVQQFWNNCKSWFANKLSVDSQPDKVTITIKTANSEDLASGEIVSATTTQAGMMSSADKLKLDGIASGATANIGTITEVKTSTPLTGSGTSGSVTISHSDSGVDASTYGSIQSEQETPGFGSTVQIPGFSVNATGHITSAGEHNVVIPNTAVSDTESGLMTAEQKLKLDGIEENATANEGTITGISTSAPLSGSGNSGSVTITHQNSGVTADTYGDSTNQTPGFGGTFKVNSETVNATGHVTAASSHTVTIPDTVATEDNSGLMSAEDKAKLNGIQAGATQYTLPPATDKTLGGVKVFKTIDSDYILTKESGLMGVAATDSSMPIPGLLVLPISDEFDNTTGVLEISSILGSKIQNNSLPPDKISGTIPDSKLQAINANKITGTIPQSILPSYVDDVLEYTNKSDFPEVGEAGKIYVETSTNLTYRWGGSSYVEISPSLAIGTTSSTAFRGDYGDVAYQHAEAKGSAFASGLYKITTNDQGHVTEATAVTKSDITNLGIPSTDTQYTLPAATDDSLGGVKTGFPKSDKNYPVQLNSSNQMYVNVPWTDTNTTYTLSSFGITATAAELNYVGGVTSNIQTQLDGKSESTHTHNLASTSNAGFLRQLNGNTSQFLRGDGTWATPSASYELPTASASTLGGIKVGSNLSISSGVLTVKVASDTDFKAYLGLS